MLRHILIAFFSCLLVFLCYLFVRTTYESQDGYCIQQMHRQLKNRTIFQTAHLLARWEQLDQTADELIAEYQLIKDNVPGSVLPSHTAEGDISDSESSGTEDSTPIDPYFVEQEGSLIRTSYFEFTIPADWIGKVELIPSKSASVFHLYYTEGLTEEAKEYGYYQSIFDIVLYTDPVDLDNAYSMHERFDILGVADGTTFVLTQRTDSALEFYSPEQWEQIKSIVSGNEFPQIIQSFTLY